MEDVGLTESLIIARMLALYVPLKRIQDGNPVVDKAMEAYLALEHTLESALRTEIRKHRENGTGTAK